MEQAFSDILRNMKSYNALQDTKRVKMAYTTALKHHGSQKRISGEPYMFHPLAVASLLTELKADEDAIIAALLHDLLEDTSLSLSEIEHEFGKDVALLVDGVTKISREEYSTDDPQKWRLASLRKMFEIMGQDIRAILIKICDRLHNMKTLSALPKEKQQRIAEETLQIYVPLAKKLNLEKLRQQLITECYKTLFPDIHSQLITTQKQNARKAKNAKGRIEKLLQKPEGDFGDIEVRIFPKIYFFSSEETEEHVAALEIAKTHIIQIVPSQIDQCYQTLFLLHKKYTVQPHAFKDYISNPKENGYQALHTRLVDTKGNVLSIQILTKEMASLAWKGIAVYWNGKKDALRYKNIRKFPLRIRWLEELTKFSEEQKEHDLDEMEEYLHADFLKKPIFVIDTYGKAIDLPEGSTVLDFLYRHSPDQAGRTKEVFLNKLPVDLSHTLKDGDRIEFKYDDLLRADVSWLNFVQTYSARKSIQADLAKTPKQKKISIGKTLLQNEFDAEHKGMISTYPHKMWKRVYAFFQVADGDELLAHIGSGKIQANRVYAEFFENNEKSTHRHQRCRYVIAFESSKKLTSFLFEKIQKYKLTLHEMLFRHSKNGSQAILEIEEPSSGKIQKFLREIRTHEAVKNIQMVTPAYKKMFLSVLWASVALLLGVFFLFIKEFEIIQSSTTGFMKNIITYAPFVILLIANMLSIRTMRNYLSWMRKDRTYVILGVAIDVVSMTALILLFRYHNIEFSILTFLGLFLIGIFINTYQFTREEKFS